MTNLIGISGKLQSGKDTVTNIIQWLLLNQDRGTEIPFDKFDLYKEAATWKNVKFADKLKDMVCLLLGCTREQLEDPKFKESPLGEEWVRYAFADGFFQSSKGTVMNSKPCSKERYEEELRINWQTAYKLEHTPRTILQLLGTECGREIIHPNIWVNATFIDFANKEEWFRKETGLTRTEYLTKNGHSNEYKTLNEQFFKSLPNWIISDVRFPNEAEAIKDRNGILIRVERFCYDSSEDFLVCNPDPELRKIGIQDYNINKTLSLEEITDIAKVHGYIPLSEQHESETALDNYTDWDYIIDNNGTIEDLIEQVKEILIKEKIWKAY